MKLTLWERLVVWYWRHIRRRQEAGVVILMEATGQHNVVLHSDDGAVSVLRRIEPMPGSDGRRVTE